MTIAEHLLAIADELERDNYDASPRWLMTLYRELRESFGHATQDAAAFRRAAELAAQEQPK